MGGCILVICKHHVILFNRLEHLQILVSMGERVLDQSLLIYRDNCTLNSLKDFFIFLLHFCLFLNLFIFIYWAVSGLIAAHRIFIVS